MPTRDQEELDRQVIIRGGMVILALTSDGLANRNANRGYSRESTRANQFAERPLLSSSGASGGSLHRGASFKVEKAHFAA